MVWMVIKVVKCDTIGLKLHACLWGQQGLRTWLWAMVLDIINTDDKENNDEK